MTTIFDKILSGEIPCDEVFSDNKCLAFKDITPQAPTHILIIPRKPIPSLQQIKQEDKELLGHLLLKGTEIANAAEEAVIARISGWFSLSYEITVGNN